KTVLDVATGGGHVAKRLREAGCEVVTCDSAPGMQPDVICRAEDLPFADGSFDVVTCRIAAHHFEDPAPALREFARVARELVLVVQGLPGREGRFHGLRNRSYGTNLVAGVTPGKGGQDVEGVPVYDTVAEAVEETGANTTMVFVPARFAADAIYEAVDAGIQTVICIAEGLPAHEMLRVYNYI